MGGVTLEYYDYGFGEPLSLVLAILLVWFYYRQG